MEKTKAQYLIYALLLIGFLASSLSMRHFLDHNALPSFDHRLGSTVLIAVMVSIGLQMLAHVVRAWKSRLLLEMIRPTKVRTLFKGLSIGFLFNSLLPLRLGELVRAHVVGESMSISRTVVLCTILIERITDGVILGVLALGIALGFRLHQVSLSPTMAWLGLALVVASLGLGWLLLLLHNQNRYILRTIHRLSAGLNDNLRDRTRLIAWSAIYGLNIIIKQARFVRYIVLSLAMWLIYLLSFIWLVIALLPSLSWLFHTTLAIAGYQGVAIPSGSAYLGTFQQNFVQIGHTLSNDHDGLLLLSMVAWLVLVLPISISGAVLMFANRTRPRQQKHTASAEVMKHKLYRETDISAELSHFLDAYFAGTQINQVLHNYEAGSDFRLVRTFNGGSNAITLLGWSGNALTVKKIILPQYAAKLQAQYDWLVERQHLAHIPKMGPQELTTDYYSIDIGYNEDYVPFFDFIHSEPVDRSRQIIEDLLDFMPSAVYQPRPAHNPRANLEAYIDTKVIDKIADTATLDPQIATLLNYPSLDINGQTYINFTQIIDQIRRDEQIMSDLSQYQESPIHGDLTIANIIASPETGDYVLLDPNNENQVSDPVVDMGKLYQSLHSGYEFLCQLKLVKVSGNTIQFEESLSSKYSELFAILDAKLKLTLNVANYRSLLFHEAVHYCRMLTYRANINAQTLPAFYGVAVRLLNDFYNQYQSSTHQSLTGAAKSHA